jgi:hypothetical protein
MLRYLKIVLFVAVAIFASAAWPVSDVRSFINTAQSLPGTYHTFSCADDNSETEHQLVDESIQPDEAARINRRYHERLAALFSLIPYFNHYTVAQKAATNNEIIYGIACSSKCLSTCYQYIFRLSPF